MYKLYDGYPNAALQEKWAAEGAARKLLSKVCQEVRQCDARILYFPMEQKYLVFDPQHNTIGEFEYSIEIAARKAIEILKLEASKC